MLIHPFAPLYSKSSDTLILGSFPSVKSREENFYYGNKQNRFWKVISTVYHEKIPDTIEEKKHIILKNNLALWDVIYSCDIELSKDSSIKNVTANDLSSIIVQSNIKRIFVNGKKAFSLYQKYSESKTGLSAVCLPSTSPANAQWTLEKLTEVWKEELKGK